jgi:uncharacterized protein (DUF1800 family)
MPLPTLGGTLSRKQAAHLLRRATFGPTKQQITTFTGMTIGTAIGQLFPDTSPASPPPPIDPKTGQTWVNTPSTAANSDATELEDYFLGWFVGQLLNTSLAYSAREKIVFFLHTHFTTIRSKVSSSRALYFQNELFRKYAWDTTVSLAEINFKELTKKISVDNAMILLLDGYLNVKGSPNENYARELLELYSIGRGKEGSLPTGLPDGDYGIYKELDVQIAARVLSGWDFDDTFSTIDPDTLLPRAKVKGSPMDASAHDMGTAPKTLSEHFGSYTVVPDPLLLGGGNATEASALDEISQLVDQIYAQQETARHICRKLYRFFVYHEITDTINNTIINTLATDFIAGGFKLQPIIKNILSSQHFFDSADINVVNDNFGGIIKSPLDLAAGAIRFFGVPIPDMTTATTEFYSKTLAIVGDLNYMGMRFFEPVDVSGYDAYSQFPIYHRAWITPNYLARRYKFTENLISTNPPADNPINVNILDWVTINIDGTTILNAEDLIKEVVSLLFPVPDNLTFDDSADDVNSGLTSQRLNYFMVRLTDGNGAAYWPTLLTGEPRAAITSMFNAILQSPEYQLQ